MTNTHPSMADSTLVEVVHVDGVQKKGAMKISGCKTFRVCGVATKGAKKGTRWTTAFTLSFSNDSSQWSQYENGNG